MVTTKHREHKDTPHLFEETLRLQDEPDKALPTRVAKALATPRLYVTGVADQSEVAQHISPVEGVDAAWSLALPHAHNFGLPGRTGERLDRASVEIPGGDSVEPQRPDWSGIAYQPRGASAFSHGRMRRIQGRTIEPYSGIYDNPDARKVYYPQAYPWRCVGRIFTWTNWGSPGWSWSGSGVLVGPRHVLTAGHVAPWGSSNWGMLFVPAYWDGASLYGAGASSYVSDYRGWNTGGSVAAHDTSVLRLYEPLGSQLGWMGSKVYDGGWEGGAYWSMAGYPGAIAGAQRPAYQSGIAVLDDDEDGDAMEIEHHGDASPGESGGPMFGFWSGSPYAIGSTSGGETISGGFLGIGNEDNNIEAGGSAMVDLVKWGQANWP